MKKKEAEHSKNHDVKPQAKQTQPSPTKICSTPKRDFKTIEPVRVQIVSQKPVVKNNKINFNETVNVSDQIKKDSSSKQIQNH